MWQGEYVKNTEEGPEWVRIEKKRSQIWADDLSKLAMIERIFWFEILNEFSNEWMKEYTIWDFAYWWKIIVMWLPDNTNQKTGNFCIVDLISIIFGSYILCIPSSMRTIHKYFMYNL